MARKTSMTSGSPLQLMLLFALPIFLGSVFQHLYSTVDSMVVGRYIGSDQLAAVGATGSLSFFILGFVFGLTGGFGVLVSQAYGAGDLEHARRVVANAFLLAAAIIVLFTPLAVALSRTLLVWMGTPEDILDSAARYIRILFGGYGCTMLYNVMASLMRSVGDSRTPLLFLIFSSILNVALDLLFILRFHWGVSGAAVATLVSQLVSGLLCVTYARRRYPMFRITLADLKPDFAILRRMLGLGLPMALQSSLTALGMLIMQWSINGFGSVTVAAYTAANKVEGLVSMLSMSMSQTMSTFCGQNYGAKQYRRIITGVRTGCVMILIFTGLSALVLVFAGQPMLSLFVDQSDPNRDELLRLGMTYLVTFACFLIPYNSLFIFRSSLQGIGKSIYTLYGGIMECIMRIAVSLTLPALLGFLGCCLAGPAAWVGANIPLLIAYFHEKKKLLNSAQSASNP